jgi:hypothetical protein
MFWTFKLSFVVAILAFWVLVWATFYKIGRFLYLLVTLESIWVDGWFNRESVFD